MPNHEIVAGFREDIGFLPEEQPAMQPVMQSSELGKESGYFQDRQQPIAQQFQVNQAKPNVDQMREFFPGPVSFAELPTGSRADGQRSFSYHPERAASQNASYHQEHAA
jgi:hypothetical protein